MTVPSPHEHRGWQRKRRYLLSASGYAADSILTTEPMFLWGSEQPERPPLHIFVR